MRGEPVCTSGGVPELLEALQAALVGQSRQAFDWIGGGTSGGGQPAISALPLLSDHQGLRSGGPTGRQVMTFVPAFKTPPGLFPKSKTPKEKPPGGGGVAKPGSAVHVWLWLSATLLLIGQLVWDVAKIAADFTVPSDPCWPVLLTNRKGLASLSVCDKTHEGAHKEVGKGAHQLISGFNVNDRAVIAKYARAATSAELAQRSTAKPNPNPGRGGGRQNAYSGRGVGRMTQHRAPCLWLVS